MPLYEYRCTACGKQIEVIRRFSDPPLRTCEACGGKLEKLISRSGFVLKGGGWYASGYSNTPTGSSTAETSESSSKEPASPEPATPAAPKSPGPVAPATRGGKRRASR